MALEGFDLSGRKAVVFGANTGIGSAVSLAFAEAGADVVVCAQSTEAEQSLRVKKVAREIQGMGRTSLAQAIDMTLGQGVQVTLRQAVQTLGGLDIVANCQDYFFAKPAASTSDKDWAAVTGINLDSVFYACRGAVKEFGDAGGRIVNVSSFLGERGLPNGAAYCAAKAGVINLTRALAIELAAKGVTANCIVPGWMEDMPGKGPDELNDNRLLRYIPMQRWGKPEEIALLAVYLASGESAYVNGETIAIDGGVLSHL